MSILAWIVLGLIAGFIASKIVNGTGEGALLDIVLGVVGAVAGGWLFNTFGASGVTGLNIYSILVSVVGAVVVLFLYHALTWRTGRTRLLEIGLSSVTLSRGDRKRSPRNGIFN